MSGLSLILIALLLAACALPGTAATPSIGASATASVQPPPPPTGPTAAATPSSTGSPSAAPAPDPALLELAVTSCNGGVVLDWSPSRHPDFHHYRGLRSPEREISPQYPPIAPAVEWGDVYATDPFVTSGFDASIIPSSTEWHYRVVAYDAAGRVVSASPVDAGRLHPTHDLGTLEATGIEESRTRLRWEPFEGEAECFSAYRVLYGTTGVPGTLLTTVSARDRTEIETGALHPGVTYALRVQAVRTTTLGHFVVGETEVLTHTAPEPMPSAPARPPG